MKIQNTRFCALILVATASVVGACGKKKKSTDSDVASATPTGSTIPSGTIATANISVAQGFVAIGLTTPATSLALGGADLADSDTKIYGLKNDGTAVDLITDAYKIWSTQVLPSGVYIYAGPKGGFHASFAALFKKDGSDPIALPFKDMLGQIGDKLYFDDFTTYSLTDGSAGTVETTITAAPQGYLNMTVQGNFVEISGQVCQIFAPLLNKRVPISCQSKWMPIGTDHIFVDSDVINVNDQTKTHVAMYAFAPQEPGYLITDDGVVAPESSCPSFTPTDGNTETNGLCKVTASGVTGILQTMPDGFNNKLYQVTGGYVLQLLSGVAFVSPDTSTSLDDATPAATGKPFVSKTIVDSVNQVTAVSAQGTDVFYSAEMSDGSQVTGRKSIKDGSSTTYQGSGAVTQILPLVQ